jgi:Galactosyltransferase
MPKILIAVVTCEKFKARANAQRTSWVPRIQGADVRFFLARQPREPLPDEVFLDVSDDYKSLPAKVKAMFQWAVANGYNRTMKLDDDTFVAANRIISAVPLTPYTGFLNATPPRPWCSGFAYWVDEHCMRILSEAPIPPDEWAEDRWVGGVLHTHGIMPYWDRRYALIVPGWRLPDFNTAVAICDCTGDDFHPNTGTPKTLLELQALCE